jgi:hypothetical protein
MTHDPASLLGLGQVHGMASAWDKRSDAVGDEPGQPQRVRGGAGVVRPRQCQNGGRKAPELIPQRFLRARAAQTQARSQAGCAVAEPLGALRCTTQVQPLEQRSTQPRVNEAFDVAGCLQPISKLLVGLAPELARRRVLNPCGHADENDMAEWQVAGEADMQGDPGTERVPHEGTTLVTGLRPYRLSHEPCCRRKVGPHGSRITVAGEIHRHQGVRRGQRVSEGTPEARRLREAVQQHERRARTAHLDIEWHDG